jgi:hypothetical protein
MRIFAYFAITLWLGMPASAGGLFSDSHVIQGSVATALERSTVITKPDTMNATGAVGTTVKSATKVLEDYDQQLAKPKVPATRSLTLTPSFEALQNSKTSGQRELEKELATEYGVPVSNICLTAAGACEVSYSTHGSTCFCTQGDSFELGIIQ